MIFIKSYRVYVIKLAQVRQSRRLSAFRNHLKLLIIHLRLLRTISVQKRRVKNELTLINHLRSFGIVEHVWVAVYQTIDRFFATGFATGIDRPVTIGNGDDGIKLVFQNFHIAFFLRFESRYTPIIARVKFIVSVSLSQ
jgi:hypothetical protein